VVLYVRRVDGQLPLFDAGVITVLVSAVYSIVPLLGFLAGGLQWTPLTYLPLYLWSPTPLELGMFATRHVVYLCSLAAAYLLLRGRGFVPSGPTRELPVSARAAIGLGLVSLLLYFWLLNELFDIDYHPTYDPASFAAVAAAVERMPHIVLQVSQNLFAILFLVKLCALTWLISHWRFMKYRLATGIWLGVEGLITVTRMGARTWFVLLILATGLLYHRLVKSLPVVRAALLGVVLLTGALVYGLARDLGSHFTGLDVVASSMSSRWTAMNEFQALFGISYDLYARQAAGLVGPIPSALYASEALQLVPSQLLPFAKVDPCVGYPLEAGLGVGCVLGVVAQAIIGLDHVELILRGLILGALLALLHRWYVRNHESYWATVFYLCMCLWCYYTFRGSTFVILYFVLYRFIPLLVGVRLLQSAVRLGDRTARACGV
jgi:hypothetical protein